MQTYIGGGIFAEWTGYTLILTTKDRVTTAPTNIIILEPEIWGKLVKWVYQAVSEKVKEK